MNWNDYKQLTLPPLQKGAHDNPEEGLCAMEMVAFIERLPHSDHPPCTCPVLAAFVRRTNDRMTPNDRQKLLTVLPDLVGTVSPEHERERVEFFAMQAVNVWAADALDAAGYSEHASACRAAQDLKAASAAADAAADAAAYAAADADAAHAAARAAAYAAYAADAAAYAADAAYAAAYAAAAADAAADAARAADADIIAALRQAIAIGNPTTGFTKPVPVAELAALA